MDAALGKYPSASAVFLIRCFVSSLTSFWSLSALLTVAVETPHFSAIVFNDTIVSSTLSKHHLIVFVLLLYAIFCKNAIHICHFGEFNTFFADFLCIFACSISFSSIISYIFPVILTRFRFLALYFGFSTPLCLSSIFYLLFCSICCIHCIYAYFD